MTQATSFESAWSESTTGGGTRGDSIADNFYQQFSTADIGQFYGSQRVNSGETHTDTDSSVSAMLGGVEIVDNGSSATIWSDKKDLGAFQSSGRAEKVDHNRHLSRSAWDQPADDRTLFDRAGSSTKFDYEQLQMSTAGNDRISKAKPGDKTQPAAQDSSIRNLNDAITQRSLQFPTAEEIQKAEAIMKDLLAGKNISESINKLSRDERSKIMSMVKNELLKIPGTAVYAEQNGDRSQDLVFKTKDGAIVHISEDSYGNPTNIQVRGKGWTSALGWRTAAGAVNVYENRDARPASQNGSNPIDYLRRQTQVTEGNTPLSRYMRGDELTDDEWKQIEETSRRSGGKITIVRPHGARGD
ncbi:MAG: hypothetical protein K2Y39_17325 [Candidatus Obscuribacterales bacterium]|nr:hypothetical protein [Candidatus Obscuribacterales bacterium]